MSLTPARDKSVRVASGASRLRASSDVFLKLGLINNTLLLSSSVVLSALRSWCSVFMGFQWVKNAVPAAVGIEDRHVENKHRIVHSLPTTKNFSPRIGDISSITANFCF